MLTLLALAPNALALSCMWGVHDANVRDLAVPPNVEIAVAYTGGSADEVELELLDASGAPVAFTATSDFSHAVMVPEQPLPAGAYDVIGADYGLSFTVEGVDDTTAPADPSFLVERERSTSEWGTEKLLLLELEGAMPGEHYEIEIATDDAFSDAQRVLGMYDSAMVGQSLCDTNVADYDHDTDYFVRVRTVDLAGNRSGWVEQEPAPRGLGCDALGGAAAGVWLLGLIGVAGRRR